MTYRKPLKGQFFLFNQPTGETKPWEPPTELPTLDGVPALAIDQETTGKNKFKDKVVGTAVYLPDGRSLYLPKRHAGGNIDHEKIDRWKKTELRNKLIVNLNTGFDAEVELQDGIDLEAQGCQLYDVAYAASLLNENRYAGFNLDSLREEYTGKPKRKWGQEIDKSRMADYHASMVAEEAIEDARTAWEIYQAQRPLIAKDQLEKVDDLESKLIWANNHIERNGARLDVDKMHRDTIALQDEVSGLCMEIWAATGVRLETGKNDTWDKLFIACGMDPNKPLTNDKGEAKSSYTDDFLKTIKNPMIEKGLRARRLMGLKSRYMDKWEKARRGDILPFSLYQLRAGEEDHGTVVGRYSATNNLHQAYKVENQVRKFGTSGYIIREWFIPDDGLEMFAADGSQLQFRLFAHLSQDKDIIRAYHEGYDRWMQGGKDVDFHQMVADLFKLTRQEAKTNNFALVMGMGRQSMAEGVNLGCNCQDERYWKWNGDKDSYKDFAVNDNHAEDCPAREANIMADKYEASFPSAKKTMEYVVKFAKNNGYVPTILGRRRRYAEFEMRNGFRQKTRFYKALASYLQGTEADFVKTKLLRVYNERNTLGIHKLRIPVHDEITGDKDKSPIYAPRIKELLNIQEIPCRVPITWAYETGANWRACSGK
jgi:DNA polymerase-1